MNINDIIIDENNVKVDFFEGPSGNGFETAKFSMRRQREESPFGTKGMSQEQGVPRSENGWKKWIETNVKNFEGKIDNAAKLMLSLNDGINYIYENLITGGLPKFPYPDIFVITDDRQDMPAIYTNQDDMNIYIKKAFLEKASKSDPNSLISLRDTNSEITFQGTTSNLFRLTGVEEGHHTAFMQVNPEIEFLKIQTSRANYNADEAEYIALMWKIRFAEEKHMPEITLSTLRAQLAEATPVRQRKVKLQFSRKLLPPGTTLI